jgi:hypothetical protein
MEDLAEKERIAVVRNRRTDAMFVAAYIAVIGLCYMVVFVPEIDTYAQGVITMVLGVFLRELGGMYAFENGTTRSSQNKDATIKSLAETPKPTEGNP